MNTYGHRIQDKSIPSLGTNEQVAGASSQMKSGLRHFYFDRIFFNTAKLTARVDDLLSRVAIGSTFPRMVG
jgi:hypothetical protein